MDPRHETQRRQIEDILLCPICAEMFQDARFLPCGHTFCRRCIEQCQSFIGMSCPLCRRNFFLSRSSELPRNFIAEDIVDAVRNLRENEINGDGIENTIVRARILEIEPKPESSLLWRTCRILLFIIVALLFVASSVEEEKKDWNSQMNSFFKQIHEKLFGSVEEEKKDWNSQMNSFFKQIHEKLFGPKKEETLLEKLNKYVHQASKSFWDAFEEYRRKIEARNQN